MEVAAATGGQALEDFARVSGMTAGQFKTLWDSDPAAAFQAFIVGLAQMDEEGISAIATLQEIGVAEIRLRDTLLRAVNANELFSKAQEMANIAWDENTALTEEANKRYATTESRLTNLKNTAVLFAQQIGDDLDVYKRQELPCPRRQRVGHRREAHLPARRDGRGRGGVVRPALRLDAGKPDDPLHRRQRGHDRRRTEG